jgi:PTH1 family peptidyl-tRNA hydrolase
MFPSLVAGLGNPGREYESTRHNLGVVVLEAFARRHRLAWRRAPQFEGEVARWDLPEGSPCWLVKPLTFMNECGRSVSAMARYYRVETREFVAVYDDLTIDFGLVKVTVGGSAGGHNGVASLIAHLGAGFARYRLGIGPKSPPQLELADFVLGRFPPEQQTAIQEKLESYVLGLELLLTRGIEPAMNQLNRRDTK